MASATANDVINRAGRRSKILAGEEAFAAAEGADALQLLNDMMHGFGPRGIHYAHVDLTGPQTVNVPDEQIRNLVLLFVRELALDYGKPIDPDLKVEIIRAEQEMQAAYYTVPPAPVDRALIRRTVGYPFNIERGDT